MPSKEKLPENQRGAAPTSKKNSFQQAMDFLQKKDIPKAIYFLEETIFQNPHHEQAFYQLGLLLHKKGKFQKAIKCFKKTQEINPKHTDALLALSIVYNDIGHYSKGKKLFERAQENTQKRGDDPHIRQIFGEKHLELSELYLSHERYARAQQELDKIEVSEGPLHEKKIVLGGKILVKLGQREEAKKFLMNEKAKNPDYLELRLGLGLIYYSEGAIDQAQREWQRLLAKNPNFSKAKKYLKLSQNANEMTLIQ